MNKHYHTPVLLNEVIEYLNIKPDGNYLDCTLGEAGHSREIFKKLNSSGILTSLDHDQEAIDFVFNEYPEEVELQNWNVVKTNFRKMDDQIKKGSLDGILIDLGLSSRQLEIPGRGFSFNEDTDPLDMRMDDDLGVTASDLINALDERQLSKLFFTYGEERYSKKIAKLIKKSDGGMKSVSDLNEAISRAMSAAGSDKGSSQRIYQALRIVVNDELESLRIGLIKSLSLLRPNGRLVVISFHSLEDRIVKTFMREQSSEGKVTILTKKPVMATQSELDENSRSSSAKLRACEFL